VPQTSLWGIFIPSAVLPQVNLCVNLSSLQINKQVNFKFHLSFTSITAKHISNFQKNFISSPLIILPLNPPIIIVRSTQLPPQSHSSNYKQLDSDRNSKGNGSQPQAGLAGELKMRSNKTNLHIPIYPEASSVGASDKWLIDQGGIVKKVSQTTWTNSVGTALHFPLAHNIDSVATSTNCAITTVVREGLTGQKLSANASVTNMTADVSFTGRTIASGSVGFLVYLADMAGETSINCTGYVADGAAFTNHFSCAFALYQPGWYFIPVHPPTSQASSKWAIGGGSPSFGTTSFTRARLRADFPSGKRPAIEIFGVYENPRSTKGQVVICFDDCYGNAYATGLPILEKYLLKSTFGIIANLIGTGAYMTLSDLRDVVARGHEIVPHGPIGGTGSLQNYEALPDRYERVVADVAAQQSFLTANALTTNGSNNIYIYPQGFKAFDGNGSGNTEIINALRSVGIVAARGVTDNRYDMPPHPVASKLDLFDLKIAGHQYAGGTEAANITAIIQRIRDAGQQGRHIILMLHKVVAGTPATSLEIQTTNLTAICEAIADEVNAGRLQSGTLTSLYSSLAAH
jgi:hypothetical protein